MDGHVPYIKPQEIWKEREREREKGGGEGENEKQNNDSDLKKKVFSRNGNWS